MTNQVMEPKVSAPINREGGSIIVRLVIAAGILVALALVIINLPSGNLRDENLVTAPVNLSPLPQDGRAYFTEPYWNAAKEPKASLETGEEEWSYYTERYWSKSR